jgi:glycerol-3-phosphate acyltransferase PlsY
MRYAICAAMIVVGYLAGSVSFAIIVTRLRIGKDIRTLGNENPGTANVGRTLGRGWGALVFLGDMLKALLPMLAARLLFFRGNGFWEILAVFAAGLAAMVGHCRPLYFGFRGGGGAASALPVMFFFAPVEAAASLLLACLAVLLFVRKGVRFRIGRWIPMLFLTIAPFLATAVNALADVPLTARVSIGGHPWAVVVGMFATSFLVLGFSLKVLRQAVSDPALSA